MKKHKFTSLVEIKKAVEKGLVVYWQNKLNVVKKEEGSWRITSPTPGGGWVSLLWRGKLDSEPSEFYYLETQVKPIAAVKAPTAKSTGRKALKVSIPKGFGH